MKRTKSAAAGAAAPRPGGPRHGVPVLEGRPAGEGRRIAIAVARFNEDVTTRLLDGAVAALLGAGVASQDVFVVRVPGAFELPAAAARLIAQDRFDAVVALGCVIRGATDHYDFVCAAAQQGLLRVGLDTGVPVLFGVLTCEDEEQALERSGGEHGNKGADVALDALRLADLNDGALSVPYRGASAGARS